MTTDTEFEPIVKRLTVARPPEETFRFYTEQISVWWPKARYSTGGNNVADVVLERREGGRFYEMLKDGSEVEWGTVTAWDPPHRVAYTWHPGRPAEKVTEVEITFTPQGEGETLLVLTHMHWERLGDEAADLRAGYNGGWDEVLLTCFETYVRTGTPVVLQSF